MKNKIIIVNCCVTIKTVMFVKKFLGSFLISFFESSNFGFCNITIKRATLNYESFPTDFI